MKTNRVENMESEETKGTKVFVGNVPFYCTKEEFEQCFDKLDGFVMADVIRRYKSNLTRGFGFVVFETPEDANKLIEQKEMNFKNRVLRFSEYDLENKEQPRNKNKKNKFQIFVSNLEENMENEDLKELFSDYDITSCFVNKKYGKTTGVVTVNSYDEYKNILNNPPKYGEDFLVVKPFKKQIKRDNNPQQMSAKVAFREGFRAGHMAGFQEGFKQGQEHKGNTE